MLATDTAQTVPASIRAIDAELGRAASALLVAYLGGRQFIVPKRVPPWLRVLGEDVANGLVEGFAGEHIYVPRSLRTPTHNEADVRDLARLGYGTSEIAERTGLSVRGVRKILSRIAHP